MMKLSYNEGIPILTIDEWKLEGWISMPPKYSNQNAIVFSNDVIDNYIEKNIYEIIKGYKSTDFPDHNIEIVIGPVSIDNIPDILNEIPYPFTSFKIGVSGEAYVIKFDLIQLIGENDDEWDKKWTNEFYFDSFAKIIKNDNESGIEILYEKGDFIFLELSLIISEKTINDAFNIGLKKIKEILNKVEYSINGLGDFFEVLDIWKNKKIVKDEFFWHTLLKKYSWLLSLIINEPAIIVEDEAYVGGKSIKNKKGNLIDFIYQNKISENIALIEIKTPQTKLLGKKYRNTFTLSSELTGSINQLLLYRDSFQKNFYSLVHNSNSSFCIISPNMYLIVGSQELLSKEEKECFEIFRKNISNISIITFDELFEKAFFILTMIQNNTIRN